RGGNTRLEIMRMLFEEANDIRFQVIDCLFIPWTSESDCIVGHLNENTTQGRMTLIDKARGYRDFKIEYEKEHNTELGQRKLAALLKEKGASVSQTLLVSMNYALDILEPIIPGTLASGLGKPQIEKIKKLSRAFERLVSAHNLFDETTRETQIIAEFHQILSSHDGDEWDLDLVIVSFIHRLEEMIESADYATIEYDLNACLKTNPWDVELISTLPRDSNNDEREESQNGSLENHQIDMNSTSSVDQVTTEEHAGISINASTTKPIEALEKTGSPDQQIESISPPTSEPTDSVTNISLHLPDSMLSGGEVDLKSYRARIYTLALQFAQSSGIHRCVLPWKYGYGYFLDLPKSKLANDMSAEQSTKDPEYKLLTNRFIKERGEAQKSFSWWMLWQAQGLLDFRDHQPVPGYTKMPECIMKSLVMQMYNPEDTNLYKLSFSAMGKIWLTAGGPRNVADMAMAFSYVTPKNMMKYITLLEARTQMMNYVEENAISLWEDSTL
ncbi:MAG: hypothetical protein HKN34_06170, partial [Gammaproteobacteria bacterium]|nr:hypothetical protein [Gammaproteobacteria bacterium]